MSMIDFAQNNKLDKLDKKLKRLEREKNGEKVMSKIINELVGMDCVIDSEDLFEEKCTVEDFDGEWIKLRVYNKKGDKTIVVHIDTIEKFEIV